MLLIGCCTFTPKPDGNVLIYFLKENKRKFNRFASVSPLLDHRYISNRLVYID